MDTDTKEAKKCTPWLVPKCQAKTQSMFISKMQKENKHQRKN